MAIVPSEPGPSRLWRQSPVGSGGQPDDVRTPGTAGVQDSATPELRISRADPAGPVPAGSLGNLFAVLVRSKEFNDVFKQMTALGMKVKTGKNLSSRSSFRPGGCYDYYTNTFELLADALSHRGPISDVSTLETIGHEVRHAHQHRTLLQRSNQQGGTEAVRERLLDEAMAAMGRARYLSSFLVMEQQAERFGVRVTLEALGDDHPGLEVFREMFPGTTVRAFLDWKVDTWWSANRNLYESQAARVWDDFVERVRP